MPQHRTRGQGAVKGSPSLGDVWADWSLSGSPKAPQPLRQLPGFLPKEDFCELGGCSEPTGQGRCLWRGMGRDKQAMGLNLLPPS